MKYFTQICVIGLLGFSSQLVMAQSDEGDSEQNESHSGSGFPLGPFRLLPTLGLTVGYDSNLLFTEDNELESWFTKLSPGLRLDAGGETNNFAVTYQGDWANYQDSPLDNYRDNRFDLNWFYNPKVRHAFALDAFYNRGRDPRGTGSREGEQARLALEPDEFRSTGLNGMYRFGAPGARGNLVVEGGVGKREYLNNEEFTVFRNRDEDNLGASFYWRLGGNTRGIVSAKQSSFDYDVSDLDSTENRYLVGAEFDFSGKTTGKALIGRLEKDFDASNRADFTGVMWRVGAQWRPRTYSVLDLTTGRDSTETNGTGDFILRRDVTLAWTHSWSDRFRTSVDGGVAEDEYQGASRTDDVIFYGVGGQYDFRDWIRFGAGLKAYERDSSVSNLNYDRLQGLLTAEITL